VRFARVEHVMELN